MPPTSPAEIEYVTDRPGHEYRYSLDCSKMERLGWTPQYDFERGLAKTVKWYRENQEWWYPLKRQNR
jgi:dTDP-glucose 4,6-dehydratase